MKRLFNFIVSKRFNRMIARKIRKKDYNVVKCLKPIKWDNLT